MAGTNLNVTELDFDQIKSNLKNFLKQQTEFNDYDFDGSGLSVLLDVLAYNTHYNALNAHYSLNEAFLDSAQIRGNVVTRAKLLGYVPRSVLAPRATVDISVDTTGESQIADSLTLPRGAKLKTNVSGDSFNYVVLSDTSVAHDATNNRYLFSDVQIAQGVYKSMAYRVDNDIENQKFQLGDKDADVSTLRVRLQQNEEAVSFDIYTPFSTLLNLDSTSQIYYTQENPSELFEVYFGDGIIGKKPVNNNIVTLDYVHTQGPESNGAGGAINSTTGFNMIDNIVGRDPSNNNVSYSSITVTTKALSSGGTERETMESIRFNAPLSFTSQNRAVTSDDYRSIILRNFSNISSISTWGGEDNDPVDFGRVYISIKPLTADLLTTVEKQNIKEAILKGKNIVSVTPEIVDPAFTNLELDVFFKYNPNLTDRTSIDLQTIVKDTIADYNFNNLNKFDGVFRHSQLLNLIDRSDPSILNSTIRPFMFQNITVSNLVNNNNFTINYAAPLFVSGQSTNFVLTSTAIPIGGVDHFIGDRPVTGTTDRTLILYKIVDGENITVLRDIGTMNVSTGTLTISATDGFAADASTSVRLTVIPNSLDIAPKRNQLLNIDPTRVIATAQVDTISTAGSSGSIDYTVNSRFR